MPLSFALVGSGRGSGTTDTINSVSVVSGRLYVLDLAYAPSTTPQAVVPSPSGLGISWDRADVPFGEYSNQCARFRGVASADASGDLEITLSHSCDWVMASLVEVQGFEPGDNGANAVLQTTKSVDENLNLSAFGSPANRALTMYMTTFGGVSTGELSSNQELVDTFFLGGGPDISGVIGSGSDPDQEGQTFSIVWSGGYTKNSLASEIAASSAPATIGDPLDEAVIMWSGHSLMDQPIPNYVQLLAEDADLGIDWQRQSELGSPIRARTRGNGEHPGTPPWNGYSSGANRTGENLDLITHFRDVTAVSGKTTADPYTHLVICERHDLLGTLQWEDTIRYLRHYYELIREGSPDCLGYFYSTWLDYDIEDLETWIEYARETDLATAAVVSRINASLELEERGDRLQIIPVSGALATLVERATQGTVPGITQGTVQDTMDLIFSDTVHQTNLGKYYISCVVYGAIYRRSPLGMDYPGEYVTSTQAASLQGIAWDVLLETYGDAPHTGPQFSAEDAQQEIVGYVPIYADVINATINVPELQAMFGGTSTDLYFDPENDDIWYPAPAGPPVEAFVGVLHSVSSAQFSSGEGSPIWSGSLSSVSSSQVSSLSGIFGDPAPPHHRSPRMISAVHSSYFVQDPSETVDYSFNWSPLIFSDEIISSSWSGPEGVNLGSSTHDQSTTTVWVRDVPLESFEIRNEIQTVRGRRLVRSFRIIGAHK